MKNKSILKLIIPIFLMLMSAFAKAGDNLAQKSPAEVATNLANSNQPSQLQETVLGILSNLKTNPSKFTRSYQGADKSWLFLLKELQHVSKGAFWQADDFSNDPRTVIIDYAKQLEDFGIKIILIPVPPKAVIYPEKLSEKLQGKEKQIITYNSETIADFYNPLNEAGIHVMNLTQDFKDLRTLLEEEQKGEHLYLHQDTHWSPLAVKYASARVFSKIQELGVDITKSKTIKFDFGDPKKINIRGDLLEEGFSQPLQAITTYPAGQVAGDGNVTPVAEDKNSEVIVIGDSHCLVFYDGGEMHCKGSGFIDHLQAHLQTPVAVFATRAGGSSSAPRNLYWHIKREESENSSTNYLANKKVLIWLFAEREFTINKWNKNLVLQKK